MSDPRRRSIQRIREHLARAAAPGLEVSKRLENYFFDDDLAAEADITVRDGDAFRLVVIEDAAPRQRDAVIGLWHRFAEEVWVVDLRGRSIIQARRGQPHRTLVGSEKLATTAFAGLVLTVEQLFA